MVSYYSVLIYFRNYNFVGELNSKSYFFTSSVLSRIKYVLSISFTGTQYKRGYLQVGQNYAAQGERELCMSL